MAEERASCLLCRKVITVRGLREGVSSAAEHGEHVAAIAEEDALVNNQGGLATRGNPGGHLVGCSEPQVLFESKLNALLEEVSPDSCLFPFLSAQQQLTAKSALLGQQHALEHRGSYHESVPVLH